MQTKPEDIILVKCGGFSTQLERNVGERIDGHPLWGSRFDATNPSAVVQTHLDFLQNGAQIILSNTYQASVEGYMQHLNLSREESIKLMRKSVQLAKDAKEQYIKILESQKGQIEAGLPLIMASIGPYGAHLHDGSEYNGSYADDITKKELQSWHRTRIEVCLEESVDGLAIETIPCQIEAVALVEMVLKDYDKVKFWISFQCKDEQHLAHGEKFASAVTAVWQQVQAANAADRLLGIGANCLNPKFVIPLFESVHKELAKLKTKLPPFIVYSNRGEIYDSDVGEWTGAEGCVSLDTYVPEWLKLGIKIVGGCCRVYPEDILKIRKCIDNTCNDFSPNA